MLEGMAEKFVNALNTVSGQVGLVPVAYLNHPVLGKTLVRVEEGAKPYVPELFKPRSAEEFLADHPSEEIVGETTGVTDTDTGFRDSEEEID